jgi:hypothetical protein
MDEFYRMPLFYKPIEGLNAIDSKGFAVVVEV